MSRPSDRAQIRAFRAAGWMFRRSEGLIKYPWLWPVAHLLVMAGVDLYEWASGQDFAQSLAIYHHLGDDDIYMAWLKANDKFQSEREDAWAENEY